MDYIKLDERELHCPYCGCVQVDPWELEGASGITYCDDCEEDFIYSRDIKVTYMSEKVVE